MFAGPEDEENSGDESTQKQAEEASEEEKDSKKKSGFFKRFMEFLAEEDEEEDEGGSEAKQAVADTVSDGKGQILSGASEENKEALAQLDKEDKEQRKRKKKKDKKKKETGGTGKIQKTGEDADEAEDPKKNEEPKAGQSEKEKKEKNPKETKNEEDQLVKIPKKNLRATMLFSLTIVVAVLLCCLFVPELFELRSARNAYYKGDYEKCFRTFYGKHLSENDRIMYEHSVMQLLIGRKEEAYQSYVAVGDELRALDVLLQAVKEQDALLAEAEKYGLADAEAEQYKKVLSILSDKYGLNEAAAKEINAYKEDAVYTLRLKSIVEKTPFTLPDYIDAEAYNMASVSGADEDSTVQITDEMSGTEQDLLPAEEELSDTNFTDNTN